MATETLRPDAAGDECNISSETGDACPNHYLNVDEEVADGDTTRVRNANVDWERDLYNIADHSVGSGTINKITVYAVVKASTAFPDNTFLKIACKTGGTAYEGSEETHDVEEYKTYSKEWADNPGGGAWSWDDIDALQVGVNIREPKVNNATYCTQVYIEVDYTVAVIEQSVGGGAITPTGALGLKTLITVGAGSITPTGALGRLIKIATGAGSITPTGALNRLIKIAVGAGSITPTGALSTVKRFIQSVGSGAITPVGTLSRLIKIGVGAGAITPTGALGRKIFITVGGGAVTIAGTLNRIIKLAVGQGAVTIAGTLNRLIKIAVGQGTITPAGALAAIKIKVLELTVYLHSRSLEVALHTRSLTIKLHSRALTVAQHARSLTTKLWKRTLTIVTRGD